MSQPGDTARTGNWGFDQIHGHEGSSFMKGGHHAAAVKRHFRSRKTNSPSESLEGKVLLLNSCAHPSPSSASPEPIVWSWQCPRPPDALWDSARCEDVLLPLCPSPQLPPWSCDAEPGELLQTVHAGSPTSFPAALCPSPLS